MKVLKLLRWIALSMVLICSAFSLVPAYAAENVPQEVLDLRKCVVRILCYSGEDIFTGSGFAIGSEEPVSYIVTNFHVIEGADDIEIMRAKDLLVKATIAVKLPLSDLCVLKLEEPLFDTPPAVLFDEKLSEAGEAVYSLGFPSAADTLSDSITGTAGDVTLTDGIISSVKSLTLYEGGQPVRLLQINAAINPGNSGGPLVNKAGQVIGINSYGALDSQNINGAISILELIDALKQKGIAYKSALAANQSEAKTENAPSVWMTVLIIALGVLLVLGVVFALLALKKKSKNKNAFQGIKLEEYLKQWGGKLPFEMAIQILTPVLQQLASKHAQGLCHLDICPDRIQILNITQGYLLTSSSAHERDHVVFNPNFAAPEQYLSETRLGPWSDVYSLSAVLFFMVTGTKPQGVLQRKLEDDTVSSVLENAGLSAQSKSFIESGLAISASERPQNALELLHKLRIAFNPDMPTDDIREIQAKRKPLKLNKKKVLIAAAIVLAVALPSVIAGGFITLQNHYTSAFAYVEEQNYKDAYEEWKVIPEAYKDTSRLGQYIMANIEIDYKNFKKAKERFEKLGNYRNSREMIQEVDYQEALYFLDQKDFDKSRELFKTLGKYKDSNTMPMEIDYQEAYEWFKNKNFEKAHKALATLVDLKYKDSADKLFEVDCGWAQWQIEKNNFKSALNIISVSNHKDASTKLTEIKGQIYKKAVGLYHNSKYVDAKSVFSLIESTEDSKSYLLLCNAHVITNFSYDNVKSIFHSIKNLGSFEDAQELMVSDNFILYMLEGYWKNSSYYLSFYYTKKDDSWHVLTTLPMYLDSFYISNGTFFVGDVSYTLDSMKKSLDFTFTSQNSMSVFSYKNSRTYDLKRR